MIPKTILYCCFGGKELPKSAKKCIKSWQKFLPDYRIMRWDESNFDVNICRYTKEAYECKKYAFVSDVTGFSHFLAIGHFDTDVEVIRSMDYIITAGPFMGCKNSVPEKSTIDKMGINPKFGLGPALGLGLYKEILDKYSQMSFYNADGTQNLTTVVKYVTEILCNKGLQAVNAIQAVVGVTIYPKEYFCPLDYYSRRLHITQNTMSIHHYDASWYPWKPYEKLYYWIKRNLGAGFVQDCARFLNIFRR